MSGATSYQGVRAKLASYGRAGVKTTLLEFDSNGGEAQGMIELTTFMQDLKAETGMKFIGVVTGGCYSAAYGIASVCDKLYATQDSGLGSIGAMLLHLDATKYYKKRGLSYKILRSKEDKARGSHFESLDEKTKAMYAKSLQEIDTRFNMLVTKREKLSLDTVIGLKGGVVDAKEAVTLGLADKVIPYFDLKFIKELNMTKQDKKALLKVVEAKVDAAVKPLQTSLAAMDKTLQTLAKAKTKAKATGKKVKAQAKAPTTFKKIMKLSEQFGNVSLGIKLVEKGTSFKKARATMLADYQARGNSNAILQENGEFSFTTASVETDDDDFTSA